MSCSQRIYSVTFSDLKKINLHAFFYRIYPSSIRNFSYLDLFDISTGVHYRTRNYYINQINFFLSTNM